MRTLSVAAQAKIAQQYGNEPINIIGIKWEDNGNEVYYADKDIPGVADGAILNLSPIDRVVNLNRGSDSAEYSVELDDTNGTLKSLMDSFDIHKRKVTLYQYFDGMAIGDAFVLFKGEIVSPIVWNVDKRTINFNILSVLEDQDVGFAPEQGKFEYIDESSIGQPWPLAFGSVAYVPGVKVAEAARGTLGEPLGYPDQSLYVKRDELKRRLKVLKQQADFFQSLGNAAATLSPPAQEILDKYLALIVVEDNQIPLWKQLYFVMSEVEERKSKTKTSYIRKRLDTKLAFIREILRNFNRLPEFIAEQKKLVKDAISLLKFEQRTRSDLYDQALDLFEQAGDAIVALAEIEDFIVDQEAYAKGSFVVIGGEKFPQNEVTDIVINNLRIRGTFSGQTFTPQRHALARYSNVAIAARQARQLDAFWIQDSSISLKDLFIWATIRKEEENDDGTTSVNFYYVVAKVVDQIGSKIVIELTEKTDTEYSFPGSLDDSIQARSDVSIRTKRILTAYNANLPLEEEEFNNLVELETLAQRDKGFIIPATFIFPEERYQFVAAEIVEIHEASPVILSNWVEAMRPAYIEALPDIGMWYADAGAEVRPADDETITYVGNILPAEIKSVHAYRVVDNRKILATVPPSYYEVGDKNLGGFVHPCYVTLTKPLSQFVGEQWEDDIYITQVSTEGPNTVDIIEWLIDTYADGYSYDATSFNAVKTKLANYPMHFAILEQKPLLQMLKDLAWQARCAIWLSGDTFYLRYLSEEPTSIATITEADVEIESLEVYTQPTEDLVTKFKALWQKDYAQQDPIITTVEHNVNKYGAITKEYDFYGYTDLSLVSKSATFWLIRYSNTWKFVRFRCFLPKLEIETLDCITLNFGYNYIANEPVKAIVESAKYDSANYVIEIEAWVPVKAGSMETYDLFWPSSVSATTEFPTTQEIVEGNAGSGPPHSEASGSLTNNGSGDRPSNYGTRFLSDSAFTTPDNPIALIPAPNAAFGIPNRKMPPKVPRLVVPNVNNQVEDPKETKKEFIVGVVIEQLNDTTYNVRLFDGQNIQTTVDLNHSGKFFPNGATVIACYDKQEKEWTMVGEIDYFWLKEGTITEVHENYYRVDIGLGEDVRVMKPFQHQKREYHNKEIRGVRYTHLNDYQRIAITGEPEELEEPNQKLEGTRLWVETLHPNVPYVGKKIVVSQLREPVLIQVDADDLDETLDDRLEELELESEEIFGQILEIREELMEATEEWNDLSGEAVELDSSIDPVDPENEDSTQVEEARQRLFVLQKKRDAAERRQQNILERLEELVEEIERLEQQRVPIYWIDANIEGANWMVVPDYQGTVQSDWTPGNGLCTVKIDGYFDSDGEDLIFKVSCQTTGSEKMFVNDRVKVTVFQETNGNRTVLITEHFGRARWIELTMPDTIAGVNQGYNPEIIALSNPMELTWDEGATGVALLKDNGSYMLINTKCKAQDDIVDGDG